MKKIFKILLAILATLVILVVVAYLTAGIWLKTAVSTLVPQMTKTSASLDEADVSLLRGRLVLKGFKIANPAGFTHLNAFELGEISVKFEPKSLLTSKIIINEIKIDRTKVDAEIAKSGNMNLMVLNNNVQEYLGNPVAAKVPSDTKQQKPATPKSDKAVVVKDLSITNSSLNFALLGHGTKVELPNIHETNIGEKKKETFVNLVAGIFTKLTTDSLKAISRVGQESVNGLLDSLAGRSKEAAGFVKGIKGQMKNMF